VCGKFAILEVTKSLSCSRQIFGHLFYTGSRKKRPCRIVYSTSDFTTLKQTANNKFL
jgi:hypothetical protein